MPRSKLLLVPLSKLPPVERLTLATVTSVPEWHPEHDTFTPFPVHAWVIRHPDGAILVEQVLVWATVQLTSGITRKPFRSPQPLTTPTWHLPKSSQSSYPICISTTVDSRTLCQLLR